MVHFGVVHNGVNLPDVLSSKIEAVSLHDGLLGPLSCLLSFAELFCLSPFPWASLERRLSHQNPSSSVLGCSFASQCLRGGPYDDLLHSFPSGGSRRAALLFCS